MFIKSKSLKMNAVGVGLVEMLVVVAIMSVVALGLATILVNTQNAESMMQFHSDADTLQEEVRAFLSSTAACKATFGSISPVANTKYNISTINSDAGVPTYKVNDSKAYGNTSLFIDSMVLSNFIKSATFTYKGEMNLQINLRPAKAKGGQIARMIGISMELDASNKITACVPLAQMSDGIWQRVKPGLNDIMYIGPLGKSAPATPGKVGIGTGIPKYDLHVEGSGLFGSFSNPILANVDALKVRGEATFTDSSANQLHFGDYPKWPSGYLTLLTKSGGIGFAHTDGTVYIGSFVGNDASGAYGQFGTVSKHQFHIYAGNDPALIFRPGTNPKSIWSEWAMVFEGVPTSVINQKNCSVCAEKNIYTTMNFIADQNIYARGIIYANQAGPSDIRLKKEIQPLESSLEKILRLEGVSFLWKDKRRGPNRQLGLIAQEVEKVFPETVTESNDKTKAVFYSALIAPIIESIKSIYAKVVALEARLDLLEGHKPLAQMAADDSHFARLEKRLAELEAENAEMKKQIQQMQSSK